VKAVGAGKGNSYGIRENEIFGMVKPRDFCQFTPPFSHVAYFIKIVFAKKIRYWPFFKLKGPKSLGTGKFFA
jgi:hypothetical protein